MPGVYEVPGGTMYHVTLIRDFKGSKRPIYIHPEVWKTYSNEHRDRAYEEWLVVFNGPEQGVSRQLCLPLPSLLQLFRQPIWLQGGLTSSLSCPQLTRLSPTVTTQLIS